MEHNGCYCTASELYNFLRIMNCDQTDGKFHVSGQVVSFMGLGEEFVIGPSACYYVGGEPVGLAGLYRSITGRGKVQVVGG